MWLATLAGDLMPAGFDDKGYVAALAALWHCAQLAVVDGAFAWMLVSDITCLKDACALTGTPFDAIRFVWQLWHCAVVLVGIWLLGLAADEKFNVLPWQAEQSMAPPG
jgi:hypothetical protein